MMARVILVVPNACLLLSPYRQCPTENCAKDSSPDGTGNNASMATASPYYPQNRLLKDNTDEPSENDADKGFHHDAPHNLREILILLHGACCINSRIGTHLG